MRGIEDMQYAAERTRDGKWVGRVREFPKLRTGPKANRLDAISEIVSLTSQRIKEVQESMGGRP